MVIMINLRLRLLVKKSFALLTHFRASHMRDPQTKNRLRMYKSLSLFPTGIQIIKTLSRTTLSLINFSLLKQVATKVISFLLIISLIAMDVAVAMKGGPGDEQDKKEGGIRRRLSDSDLPRLDASHVPPTQQSFSNPPSSSTDSSPTGSDDCEGTNALLLSHSGNGGSSLTGSSEDVSDGSLTPGQSSSTGSPQEVFTSSDSTGSTSPRSSGEEEGKSSPDSSTVLDAHKEKLREKEERKPVVFDRTQGKPGRESDQKKFQSSKTSDRIKMGARGSFARHDDVKSVEDFLNGDPIVGSVGNDSGSWVAYPNDQQMQQFLAGMLPNGGPKDKNGPLVFVPATEALKGTWPHFSIQGDDGSYVPLLSSIDPESQRASLSPKAREFLQYLQDYVIQGKTSKLQKATVVPALLVAGTSTCANINIYMFGIMKFSEWLNKEVGVDVESAAVGNTCVTIIGLLFGLDSLGRNVSSMSKMAMPSTKSFSQCKTWGQWFSEWGTVAGSTAMASPSALLAIFYMWQNAQVAMDYNNVTKIINPYTLFIIYYGPGIFVDTLIANSKEGQHFVQKYATAPIGSALQWGINVLDPWLGIKPQHPIDIAASLRQEYREMFKRLQRLCFLLPSDAVSALYNEVIKQSLLKGKKLKGQDKANLQMMDSIRVLRVLNKYTHHAQEELLGENPKKGWRNIVAEGTGWTVSIAAAWGRYIIFTYAMESLVAAIGVENAVPYYALAYTLGTIAWGMNGKLEKEYVRDLTYELLGGKKPHCHSRHPYIRAAGLPLLLAASAGTALPYVLTGADAGNEMNYRPLLIAGVVGAAAVSNMAVDLAGYRSSWRKVAFNPTDYVTSKCCDPSIGKKRDDLVWRMKTTKRLLKGMDGQTLIDIDAVVDPKDRNNWYDMMMSMAQQGQAYGATN